MGALISDVDIYRTAMLLVDQHGEDRPIHAAMRADEFLAAGDMEDLVVWKRIVRMTDELPANERPEDTGLH